MQRLEKGAKGEVETAPSADRAASIVPKKDAGCVDEAAEEVGGGEG
jgi:hypothetical protein